MEEEKKNYYFIIAGEITFMNTDGDVGITKMNTVIGHDSPNIPLKLIGKANQALSMMLVEELKDPTIKIMKIVVLTVSPMGQMTETEFYEDVRPVASTEKMN